VAGGQVTFGRALVVGSLIGIVSSLCYVATWEVIYFKLSPDFVTKYQAHIVEKAKAEGASQAAIDAKIADAQKLAVMYQNPLINSAITFAEPMPIALVVALVSAGALSRKRGDESPAFVGASNAL
jgi:hypothetical protein